jgi:hypothetical protein
MFCRNVHFLFCQISGTLLCPIYRRGYAEFFYFVLLSNTLIFSLEMSQHEHMDEGASSQDDDDLMRPSLQA